jgi:hypothetical protein
LGLAVQRRHPAARREQLTDQAVGSAQWRLQAAGVVVVLEPILLATPAQAAAAAQTSTPRQVPRLCQRTATLVAPARRTTVAAAAVLVLLAAMQWQAPAAATAATV